MSFEFAALRLGFGLAGTRQSTRESAQDLQRDPQRDLQRDPQLADARKANADDLLSEIDTDGDGEISRQEFSDHLFGTVRGVAVVDE